VERPEAPTSDRVVVTLGELSLAPFQPSRARPAPGPNCLRARLRAPCVHAGYSRRRILMRDRVRFELFVKLA